MVITAVAVIYFGGCADAAAVAELALPPVSAEDVKPQRRPTIRKTVFAVGGRPAHVSPVVCARGRVLAVGER